MDIRERAVASARAMVTTGGPGGRGGPQRYLDLIAPGETEEAQREMAAMASSGLMVAGVWRAVGVASDRLDPPFVLGTAVTRLSDVAIDAGALVSPGDGKQPSPGDTVLLAAEPRLGLSLHAYVVTAVRAVDGGIELDTVEGPPPIAARKRTWKGGKDVLEGGPADAPGRTVLGWIDVSKLPLVDGDRFIASSALLSFADGEPERLPSDVTKVTSDQMMQALEDAWTQLFGDPPKRESLLVLVAQWAQETGWGKAMHAFNIGNVKSVDGDGADYTYFACWEIISGQKRWYYPDDPGCRFRAYKTLELGAVDYLKMVSERYKTSWSAVLAGDPASFAHLLKLQKYYTGPEDVYVKNLSSIFNQLMRTTGGTSTPAAPAEPATPAPAAAPAGNALSTTLQIQQALVTLGFDPGTPDGVMGPKTKSALEDFQRSAGLDADGIVGPNTRAALAQRLAAQDASSAPAS